MWARRAARFFSLAFFLPSGALSGDAGESPSASVSDGTEAEQLLPDPTCFLFVLFFPFRTELRVLQLAVDSDD